MQDRLKRVIIVLLIIGFQFSFALVFTSSPSFLIDNLLNQYTVEANKSKPNNNYVHTKITIDNGFISNNSSNFIRENVSRSKETVTYYSLFSKNLSVPKFAAGNYSSNPSILYNPYRNDTNNKYFETFRLRQMFNDIDSRIIEEGYDFTLQINNIEADQILLVNNWGDNHEYFLDNKVEVSLVFSGNEYKGIITNLFYVEEEEPISTELYNYNGNYNLIVPSNKLRNDVSYKLYHDFINNSMRVKKEMKKLNAAFSEKNIEFFDNFESNSKITALYHTLIDKPIINLNILIPALVGFVFTAILLFLIIRSKETLNKCVIHSLPVDTFISIVSFSIIIYLLKRIFATEFFFMLSNLYSGLLTVFMLLFTIFYLYRKRMANVNGK